MKPLKWHFLLPILALVFCTGVVYHPTTHGQPSAQSALIVFPEHKYDPAVQRILAEENLRALPIGSTGVIFVIPVYEDPMLEEMQIRYLEKLIKKLESDEPAEGEL